MLAYTALGTFIGLLVFVGGLMTGHSFLYSLLLYSGVGSVVSLLAAIADMIRRSHLEARDSGTYGASCTSEAADPDTGAALSALHGGEMRILAVDDDPSVRKSIVMIASKTGHRNVVTAESGIEALELLRNGRKQEYDCFLFDICMPDLDGIELCRRVRDLPAYVNVPIIMLTAMRDKAYLDKAFLAGASDFAKPFEVTELCRKLTAARKSSEIRWAGDYREQTEIDQSGQIHAAGAEDIRIGGIENLVPLKNLENYLGSLSKPAFGNCQIVAVKITELRKFLDHSNARTLLQRSAEEINDAFGTNHGLMSHVGNGTFLIVSSPAWFTSATEVEGAIREYFLPPRNENLMWLKTHIHFLSGDPFCPSETDYHNPQMTLDRALGQLRQKEVLSAVEPHQSETVNLA